MSYTYGTKGAPAVGGGLPGLPQRGNASAALQRSTYTRIVTPGRGVIEPPEGAKFMRVAVVSAGAGSASSGSWKAGAGGGCSATKIVLAESIAYTVGAAGPGGSSAADRSGGDSSATFGSYKIVVYGAKATTAAVASTPGYGTGGDYNFTGQGTASGSAPGGGSAGPCGDGGAPLAAPVLSTIGWGVGAGSGGETNDTYTINAGGGGAGAAGGRVGTAVNRAQPASPFGREGGYAGQVAGAGSAGGEMGGGAGAGSGSTVYAGGVGGIVVEWFY